MQPDQIHGARFVSFPGVDHFYWAGNQDELLVEIERFVAEVGGEEADLDRVLATVMFTDIVGSTERAAALGDRPWKELLSSHHDAVRHLLARYRGREIDTAGDGFLAISESRARRTAPNGLFVPSEGLRPVGLRPCERLSSFCSDHTRTVQ